MRKAFIYWSSALFILFTFTENVTAQDEMDVWMEYIMPGKNQKLLAENEGKWMTEMIFWQSPDREPETSTGTVEMKMIMGGAGIYLQLLKV